jgi:dipeptidyl aminopeptidase/acylaminoacyl peptidase
MTLTNRFPKWATSLALLLGLAALTACTTTGQGSRKASAALTPRADFFAPQNNFFHRLNASGKTLAWMDLSNPGQIMTRDVTCSNCDSLVTGFALPDGGKPFMFFWTRQANKMVVVYSAPAKKRLDVATWDLTSKQFTSLFPEEHVSPGYSHAGASDFYMVPQSIFKISDKGQPVRYFKIDFENGQRVPVDLKDNILAIETVTDGAIGIRLGNKTGAQEWVYVRANGEAVPLMTFQAEDQKHNSSFLSSYTDAQQNTHALFLGSGNSDTLVVSDVELPSEKTTVIARDKADIQSVLVQAHGGMEAWVRNYLQPEWVATSPAIAKDIAFLTRQSTLLSGIWSRSNDDQRWLVTQRNASGQEIVSIYERPAQTLTPIRFATSAPAPRESATHVRAAVVNARDNTPLVSYLITPDAKACQHSDCPLVVHLHGGPHARDDYPRSPVIAWLVDRGYAVLTVNYRGSSGFGKAFEAMSNGQWGLAMQDDVLAALDWALGTGAVDPKRIAVMGASHGGYLAVNSITVAPERFTCAVASGATDDLTSFVEKVVAKQPWLAADLYQSVGDPRTPEVRAALKSRSPLAKVAAVKAPILITHGGKDQQSPLSDMEEYAAALTANGKQVALVVFPEEGHGVNHPETRLAYYGIIENFLATCLGGRHEAVALPLDKNRIDIRLGQALLSGPAPE